MERKLDGVVFKPQNSYDYWMDTFGNTKNECIHNCKKLIPQQDWEDEENYYNKLESLGKFVSVKLTIETKGE